jgi:hypothetical protein
MSIEVLLVLQILFAHWVSDFILQSHWMAVNKSKDWLALSSHVLVYTCGLMLILPVIGLVLLAINSGMPVILELNPGHFVFWALLNGGLHLITDAVTSRITSRLWSKGDAHNFFVVIGLDQFIHAFCLLTSLAYFLSLG